MSYVLQYKDNHIETYTIRCDKCGFETDPIDIPRWDAQPEDYRASVKKQGTRDVNKWAREYGLKRLEDRHLCEKCAKGRVVPTQMVLLEPGPPCPQAWLL